MPSITCRLLVSAVIFGVYTEKSKNCVINPPPQSFSIVSKVSDIDEKDDEPLEFKTVVLVFILLPVDLPSDTL